MELTTKTVIVATPARCSRLPRAGARAGTQKGVVLFIALIVLVAMTLAGIALVRSVDTANVIAGNLAFKQATLQAADLGVEVGVTALPNIVATSLDADLTPAATSTNPNYWYYATRRCDDVSGVPLQTQYVPGVACVQTSIDWDQVPVAQELFNNKVKIVIDRLCRSPTPIPVNSLLLQCSATPSALGGSQAVGRTRLTGNPTVYYRLTARIEGPRNTVSMVQTILGL
jgi:type IV pilus assembly protein PilX